MSTPFQLRLPRQLYMAMVEQALTELPYECCGIFAGRIVNSVGRVEVSYPLHNELASPIAFQSEPRDMFAAFKDMRQKGLHELAIYHSHPTSPPIPSKTDLEKNYSPDVMNLIVGLAGPEPMVRAWWLSESDFSEASWEIID